MSLNNAVNFLLQSESTMDDVLSRLANLLEP